MKSKSTSFQDKSDDHTEPTYVIDIKRLSKEFAKGSHSPGSYSTLKSLALSRVRKWWQPTRIEGAPEVNRALQDVTLRIPKGSSVGIIGRNGSGKSTLLKLITGIYRPTGGSIDVIGSLAALIELGAGFHPDFTGRENVILGGVMQGMGRREIEKLLPEITAFAELENYIDQPVRTYSSGMFMRLGFSLSVHLEPEILLIDEVLAVGDAGFVRKCKERIEAMRRRGITLLLVTHDLDSVERWCDEALWLDKGIVKDRGDPRRVIDAYRQFIEKEEEAELVAGENVSSGESPEQSDDAALVSDPGEVGAPVLNSAQGRWGSREIEITQVRLKNSQGEERQLFHPEDGMVIEIEFSFHQADLEEVVFGVGISKNDGTLVFGTNSDIEGWDLSCVPRRGSFSFEFPRIALASGVYSLDVAAHREDGYPFDFRKGVTTFMVRVDKGRVGTLDPELHWSMKSC